VTGDRSRNISSSTEGRYIGSAYKAGTLLTTREVAELLRLSPATVLRRWRAGELPGYRLASNVLRFRADELEAWLASKAGAPRPS